MSQASFRFLHASDLHLEQPPHGLTGIPDHLRDILADAPLEAASRVFETAILENVDFVILAGDVIDPETGGARAIAFLFEQIEALCEQNIHVYWCGGRADSSGRWLRDLDLPENVRLFPKGKTKPWTHSKDDRAVATVIGIGGPGKGVLDAGDFRIEPSSRFTIAVGYGQADAASLAGHKQIDYWALGGRHQSSTLFSQPQTAHYCGSPQGRGPGEPGPHGCTLVQVSPGRKVQTRFVATDVVRWSEQTLALDENAQRNDLQRELRVRMQKLASEASGVHVLVRWRIAADGALGAALRTGGLDRELLEWLRTEFGRVRPAIWTASLKLEPKGGLAEDLYEEDTILGDYLRAVREHEQDQSRSLDFGRFTPDLAKRGALAAALETGGSKSREALLQEAAVLGANLLSGDALTAEI